MLSGMALSSRGVLVSGDGSDPLGAAALPASGEAFSYQTITKVDTPCQPSAAAVAGAPSAC
ncbi:hypothetical protein GCM10010994_19650 [Chelatococcus reniformis]|uniref:Uncharacterized protein n=1 Tax=Chelatococcus reniformis TaxID=1494448 RepID=A0A916U576_9HYPH|nr:hypothetical protein GCM10010994_19650 [Chelatococcus reniformis]